MHRIRTAMATAVIIVATIGDDNVRSAGTTLVRTQRAACGARDTIPCEVPGRFVSLSAGFAHTCGIKTRGMVLCWGDGRRGALGNGKLEASRVPVPVAGSLSVVQVAAGDGFTCARTMDGAVHCWGKGQPVPGYPETQPMPVRVAMGGRAISLAAGRHHACALDEQGTAHCWGRNIEGQNGNGTSGLHASMTPEPTPVAGGARYISLATGLDFTCGLTREGAVECWGSNVDGVVGPGATEKCGDVAPVPCMSTPVRVYGNTSFAEVSAGSGHVCARTGAGSVHCWGSNSQGQLGRSPGGDEAADAVPHAIVDDGVQFASVVSAGTYSCGIARGGALYCWGADPASPSGSSAVAVSRSMPVRVHPRHRFESVYAGVHHACGVTRGQRAYCWGDRLLGHAGPRGRGE